MTDFFLIAGGRVDWGFDNPNKTGAFFALLMLACWLPVFIRHSFFPWSLLLSGLLGLVVLLTQSRGAVVAASFGFILMGIGAGCFLNKGRLWVLLAVLLVLIFFSWRSGPLAGRFAGSVEDRSVLNRLVLWDAAVHMMHDAPEGWGPGRAAEAFHQWYQPAGARLHYKNLVNSHLTWLVEWGSLARWAYLLAWGTVLVLCFPSRGKGWYIVALSCWLALVIAAFFSSVAHEPLMWLVPSALLLAVLSDRYRSRSWPPLRHWVFLPALALVFFLGIQAYVQISPRSQAIRLEKALVYLGNAARPPSALVMQPDPDVLGQRYGHVLRQWLEKHPEEVVAVEWGQPSSIPSGVKVLLLSGKFNLYRLGDLEGVSGSRIVWLNPAVSTADQDAIKSMMFKGEVVWGTLRSRPDRLIWQDWAGASGQLHFREVPGAAEFVSSWPEELSAPGAKAQ